MGEPRRCGQLCEARVLCQLRPEQHGTDPQRQRLPVLPQRVRHGEPVGQLRPQLFAAGAERQRLPVFPEQVRGRVPMNHWPVMTPEVFSVPGASLDWMVASISRETAWSPKTPMRILSLVTTGDFFSIVISIRRRCVSLA